MTAKQETCEQRIEAHLAGRLADMRDMAARMSDDDIETCEAAFEEANSYGLDLSPIAPGCYRYQLSTGGPGDEFLIYADGRVVYRFLDWFDSAERTLPAHDAATVCEFMAFDCLDWTATPTDWEV